MAELRRDAGPFSSGSGDAACIPDLIYDVGAHEGQDTEFYLKKGFRVVAVECNPALVQHLLQRFANEAASGQFMLVSSAISDQPGEIEFYVNDLHSVWSTTRPDLARRNERMGAASRKIKVAALPFASVLSQFGIPYYLKVDIEGSDVMCLEALRGFQGRPRFISLETEQSSWTAVAREFDLLRDLGYSRFQLVSQSMVPQQVVPLEPREGRHVDHRFPHGSTGLFGLELPDAWVGYHEALRKYRRIFLRHKLFGHATPGEALLRRLGPYLGSLQYRLAPGWWDTHAAI